MRRLVTLVSAVVLVDTMFYAVVAPLLPHYADTLHLSKAAAGVLTGAYPLGTLVGSIPGGMLASRAGSRVTVYIGLALMAGSSLVFGFAHNIVLLDVARFVQGLGGACSWAGGLAWLVDASPADRRGQLIGTALGAAIGGALFGPVLGAIAVATKPQYVFSTVVVMAGALAVWAWTLPAPPRHADRQPLSAVTRALRRPDVRTAMWLVILPAMAFGTIGVLGPLRLDELGASGAAVGATYLVGAALEALVSPAVGRISDRRGRLVPIRAGLIAGGALLCCFTLPQSALALAVLLVATTVAMGTFWAPAMALLSDAAEHSGLRQGFAFALVNLAWAIGQVVGSGAGGAVAKATADLVPVLVVAGAAALTLVALVRRPLAATA